MSTPAKDPSEAALVERIRLLFKELDDASPRSLEYQRLSMEIHELSVAHGNLVDAKQEVEQSTRTTDDDHSGMRGPPQVRRR
jgi:hypothetical protein